MNNNSSIPGILDPSPKGPERTTAVLELLRQNTTTQAGLAIRLVQASHMYRDVTIDIMKQEHLVIERCKEPKDVSRLLDKFNADKDRLKEIMDKAHKRLKALDSTDDAFQYFDDNQSYINYNFKKYKDRFDERVDGAPEDFVAEEFPDVVYYEDEVEEPENEVVTLAPAQVRETPDKSPIVVSDSVEERIFLNFLENEVGEVRVDELRNMANIAADAVRK